MAEPTYAEQRRKAAQLLIEQKHAGNATNPDALASAGGRPAFTRAMSDFQKSYNADPANKDNQLQDPRDMTKLVGALETTAARKTQAQVRAVDNALERPAATQSHVRTVDNRIDLENFDPEIQKAQGYMRALGITEVEVDGKKQALNVDGKNGLVTSAALAQYRAANGFDNHDNFSTVLGHMEESIKKQPPGVQQFMSETMADGQQAGGPNIMAMQLLLNLLAPLLQALSGGKVNLDQLKVDGINGPRTTNAYNGYSTAMNNNTPKPNDPAAPQQADADPLGTFAEQAVRDSDARMAATPAQPAPEIHVKPGESTQGVAAREGVIPTVVVNAPQPVVPGSRPALQVDGGLEAGSSSAGGSYARSPRAYAGDTGRYQQRQSGYGEMRQQFDVASGVQARDRMLQERAELRAIGVAPRDVTAIVRDNRLQELESSGMNRRSALNQVNIETRMVDNIEKGMTTRAGRAYGSVVQAEDRDITRISGVFGRAVGTLSDRNPRNDHQAYGNIAGAGVEAVLRGGIPGMGVGGARGGFGMGGGGNPISALMSAIGGGNSQTYAAQPLARGAYAGYDRGGAREWNGNQIRPEFGGAGSYGNAADPRMALGVVREQQIMAADQPQTPQEQRVAEDRRMREMYSPG